MSPADVLPEPAFAEAAGSRVPPLVWGLLGLIFALGLAVRLVMLDAPPVDFHPTRQLHSALIARGMYYENSSGIPAWQRDMAQAQWRMEGYIEPQVFERITAWGYAAAGSADLRIPRVLAVLLWMGAAAGLTGLTVRMAGWGGGLVAAVFFLAWPYGVLASRAFQPEPLLLALLAAALWSARRWSLAPTWAWTLAAGLLAGLAIYIKVVAVFFLAPALAALVITTMGGLRPALRDRRVWGLALLAVLPYALYHIDGVFLRGDLAGQFSLRFFPAMWTDPAFYLRWVSNLGRALPFALVLLALLGTLALPRAVDRRMLLGYWSGYVLYGLALSHHISTHDYYHLLLFPAVAMGLGGLAAPVLAGLRGPRWLTQAAAALVLLAALLHLGYEARQAIRRSSAQAVAQVWTETGLALGPRASLAALVDDYGAGLKYYAWINPSLWPTADDIRFRREVGQNFDFSSFFAEQAAGREYFLVSPLDELERQPELKEMLETRYPLLREGVDYRIYDLRAPVQEGGTP
jgi:4-amino-4-deoxy-L-arabinose transferase-like glycosyltransferase